AAQLVEMKSFLLLPRSQEAQQLKQELTGRLIEYDRCRRLAGQLRSRTRGVTVYTRPPAVLDGGSLYPLRHAAQTLADCWRNMAGRARPQPVRQEAFEPLVAAPFVSVESRVVHVLRGLATGKVDHLEQLFSKEQELSATVATFLAVLELVRAGRAEEGKDGEHGGNGGAGSRAVRPRGPCGHRQAGRRPGMARGAGTGRAGSPAGPLYAAGQRADPAAPGGPLAAGHQKRVRRLCPPHPGKPAGRAPVPGGDGDADRHRLQPAGVPRL